MTLHLFTTLHAFIGDDCQVALVVKNLPASARDSSSIPGSGRSPGRVHGNPLHLENPMDRGAWRAPVYRVMKSQTQLKQLSTHSHRRSKALVKIVVPTRHFPFLLVSLEHSSISLSPLLHRNYCTSVFHLADPVVSSVFVLVD